MKCGSCGFEWIEKPGQTLEICPICQNRFSVTEKAPAEITAAGTIKEIIKKYGISILDEKARFIGLFGDYAPKLSHEKRILQIAVYDNIANFFVRCSVSDREKNLAKAQKNLLEIFNEAASREILEMFAGAFDWDITILLKDKKIVLPLPEFQPPVEKPAAQDKKEIYILKIKTLLFGKGTYTGEINSYDEPHGKGEAVYKSGDIYNGEWKDGEWNGYGKLKYADGDVYEGEWKEGARHGIGTMTYATGTVYEGEWKNGKFDGDGKLTYADGTVCEGHWEEGQLN